MEIQGPPPPPNTIESVRKDMLETLTISGICFMGAWGAVTVWMTLIHKANDSNLVHQHQYLFILSTTLAGFFLFDGAAIFYYYQEAVEHNPWNTIRGRIMKVTFDVSGVDSILLLIVASYIPHDQMLIPLIILGLLSAFYILAHIIMCYVRSVVDPEAAQVDLTLERVRNDMIERVAIFFSWITSAFTTLLVVMSVVYKTHGIRLVEEHYVFVMIASLLYIYIIGDICAIVYVYRKATQDPWSRMIIRGMNTSFYASGIAIVSLLFTATFVPKNLMWLPEFLIPYCSVCYIVGRMFMYKPTADIEPQAPDMSMERILSDMNQIIVIFASWVAGGDCGMLIAMSLRHDAGHLALGSHKILVPTASIVGIVSLLGGVILLRYYQKATEDPWNTLLGRAWTTFFYVTGASSVLLFMVAAFVPPAYMWVPLFVIPYISVVYFLGRVFAPVLPIP